MTTDTQEEDFGGKKRLTPKEVARELGVDPKSVTRWAKAGKIGSFRTPGGHRRYDIDEVRRLLQQSGADEEQAS